MRVDIDDRDQKRLEQLKGAHYIRGKGYAETVSWLLNYHEQHVSIEQLLEEKFSKLDETIQGSILKAIQHFVKSLMSWGHPEE
jgi:hypothetical protein